VAIVTGTLRSDERFKFVSTLQSKEFLSLTTAELPGYERRTAYWVGFNWMVNDVMITISCLAE